MHVPTTLEELFDRGREGGNGILCLCCSLSLFLFLFLQASARKQRQREFLICVRGVVACVQSVLFEEKKNKTKKGQRAKKKRLLKRDKKKKKEGTKRSLLFLGPFYSSVILRSRILNPIGGRRKTRWDRSEKLLFV